MKYGIWNVLKNDPSSVDELCKAGFSPLTAAVLCSRGYDTLELAKGVLQTDGPLLDPFAMKDMDKAAGRVRSALEQGEKICVFGDYDVDGITATCLLTEFLRSQGGDCCYYIPARMEEGYGLNEAAILSLAQQGVRLLISVDCGITATQEALLCQELGLDLIITDHHECKDELPHAAAVVDPHRRDCAYPHQDLAGVGVAFKLACAIDGDQAAMLHRYCDLLCLGTVADVMPLYGENRAFVAAGLQELKSPKRAGLRALMKECGCKKQDLSASTIGYVLAPRINAAGRMGQVDKAVELFLTQDLKQAAALAADLCQLNRQRQQVESEIYDQAVAMIQAAGSQSAIVLASEQWHQGVVGIVASRLSEEFCCPTFLICLDGDKGKASSRSYGGFNLFSCLEQLSDLLESYGGHELAAGFTIQRQNIDTFRESILALCSEYQASGHCKAALELDCAVDPELLTLANVDDLSQLEPCGSGCPRPIFYMDGVTVEQLSEVGGGKHLRLRLLKRGVHLNAIFFSATILKSGVTAGDQVELAFTPQINEYRGTCSVQLNLVDLRPDSATRLRSSQDKALYESLCIGQALSKQQAEAMLPVRQEFVAVWKYLTANAVAGGLQDSVECLSRKIARFSGLPASFLRTRVCLDVFCEQGLLQLEERRGILQIHINTPTQKINLDDSAILNGLRSYKEGD